MDDPNELVGLIRRLSEDPPEAAPIWQAKRRLAAELRRIGNGLCDSHASVEEILAAAESLREQAELLERRVAAPAEIGGSPLVPGMETFRDRGPIAGQSNPVAPPAALGIDVDARRVVGEVTFGKAFEGAPGCVHGGFVSAVLDEALGMACVFAGGPAMTRELTTRYLRHTPIETRLEIAAKLDDVDGRKVRTSGHVLADGERVVESTGLFIAVGVEKFEALKAARRGETP